MSKKHFIGQPVLFFIDNNMSSIGEIIEINEREAGIQYKIREVPHGDELTEDGWLYHTVTENQILDVSANRQKLEHGEWAMEHMAELSKAFGRDMTERLFIAYDTKEQVEEEFLDFASNEEYCKQISGKWVLLLA